MIWFCPQWVLLCRYLQLVSLCLVALTVAYVGPTSPMDSKGAPSGRPEFGKAAPTAAAGLSMPPDLLSARVVRVVDGDTADVDLVGQTVRLRLIGMDTPETVDPRTSVQCFGRELRPRRRR